MVMAWEGYHNGPVLVGILHTEATTMAWSLGLRTLIVPQGQILPVAGMPFDDSRNVLAMRALDMGAEWLFFLDSDVIPPPDVILRLQKHDVPLISGVYHRRMPPVGVPVMMRGGKWVTDYPQTGVIEVDVVGAGCLLIRRDLLERFPPQDPERSRHWFCWRVQMPGLLPPGEAMSEDYTFCVAAKRQLGVPTLVDCSVQCRHAGFSEARRGQLLPLEVGPVP